MQTLIIATAELFCAKSQKLKNYNAYLSSRENVGKFLNFKTLNADKQKDTLKTIFVLIEPQNT